MWELKVLTWKGLITLDRTLNCKCVWEIKSSHEPSRRGADFGGQTAASSQIQVETTRHSTINNGIRKKQDGEENKKVL
jgi:hypothetical protein